MVFVLATVLHAWSTSIQTELSNQSEYSGSRNLAALAKKTNDLLLEKLAKHPQFEKMTQLDLFPRNFFRTTTPRQSFRT